MGCDVILTICVILDHEREMGCDVINYMCGHVCCDVINCMYHFGP